MTKSNHKIKSRQNHYDSLEVDEFWTYAGRKKNKGRLIYAYHRSAGKIVTYVWGRRNYKTAKELREKLVPPGVSYGKIRTDAQDSFIAVFRQDSCIIEKADAKGIEEGNNCRLRRRIRRAF